MTNIQVGIIGDYDETFPPHLQTDAALRHSAEDLEIKVSSGWLPTDQQHDYELFDALWCAPGSPYKSLDGALQGVRFARENGKPLLGTCGGFQHVVLEYGRNVMGLKDAAHAEYDPYASQLFVVPLSCSLKGQSLPIEILPESRAADAYGCLSAEETYYCNFGLNPAYRESLEDAGLVTSGWDLQHETRIVEIPSHPFYIATLFVPQSRSTHAMPHPLISAFMTVAVERKK
jgi:CTP synthase (UTP-ammonia lyase)